MKRSLAVAALALAALPCLQDTQDADQKVRGPEVGQPAPAIRLNDQDGRAVSLGGESEHWTVLAFFPKAATPG